MNSYRVLKHIVVKGIKRHLIQITLELNNMTDAASNIEVSIHRYWHTVVY